MRCGLSRDRPEDRAADRQDAGQGGGVQADGAVLGEPAEAVPEPDELHAVMPDRRLAEAADGGVEAGAVAAGREDADAEGPGHAALPLGLPSGRAYRPPIETGSRPPRDRVPPGGTTLQLRSYLPVEPVMPSGPTPRAVELPLVRRASLPGGPTCSRVTTPPVERTPPSGSTSRTAEPTFARRCRRSVRRGGRAAPLARRARR